MGSRGLIDKTLEVDLLSVEDIAAMKIVAITQRGTRTDFSDTCLSVQKFGLKKTPAFPQEKYKKLFNQYLALEALAYFVDAGKEKEKRRTGPSPHSS